MQLNYLTDSLKIYIYLGKNQVAEVDFDSSDEVVEFSSAIDEYNKTQTTNNQNLFTFLQNYPEYQQQETKRATIDIFCDENLVQDIENLAKNYQLSCNFNTFNNNLSLVVITQNSQNIVIKSLIKHKTKFLTLDLNQGPYATIGPMFADNLACPKCANTRFITNNLLDDFHTLAKQQNKEIKESFDNPLWNKKLIIDALTEIYLEVQFNNSNLKNQIRNYDFWTGKVWSEGVLPYPHCLCQK